MNFRLLSKLFGALLFFLSGGMWLCFAFAGWESYRGVVLHGMSELGWSASVTTFCGLGAFLFGCSSRSSGKDILRREAVVVVGIGWLLSALFGALPYVLGTPSLSVAQAFFESMSGFTTTGSTVIPKLAEWPRAILLWRSLTQWLGGVGILVLFVALLASLGVGGKSLFHLESSLREGDRKAAKVHKTAWTLLGVYLGLTGVCFLGLGYCGLGVFDAVCHALATVATGGFSTYDASIAHFQNPGVEVFLSVMMLLAGVNFLLYPALLRRDWQRLKKEEEARWYFVLVLFGVLLVTLNLLGRDAGSEEGGGFFAILRGAIFQVISIITTAGFASMDSDQWPWFSKMVLIILMFVGGCAGSTAGGLKVGRVLVFLKSVRQIVFSAFRPAQVFVLRLNGRPAENAGNAAAALICLFMGFFFLGTLALAFFEPERDLVTCLSATVATLFNIGPGFGDVGATQNFAFFSAPSYFLMSFLMMLGRLEILAVLVLFFPVLWKRY